MKQAARLALAASLLLGAHAACAAEIRALFVGIDDYPPQVDADLRGAVNDVRFIRERLAHSYKLSLDPFPPAGTCEAKSDRSITLVNGCAKRATILDSFDRLVKASKPGDTLLFYFAGHGAYGASGTRSGTQASGKNSSIVASDSRTPFGDGNVVDDILDITLKDRIDEASAHGVQVVTIFDSCNSGTATRAANDPTRAVDPAPTGDPADEALDPTTRWTPRTPPPGIRRATPIHLAAALDGQKAIEFGEGENRHGVFTVALADSFGQNPGATYGDILSDIRSRLSGQTPAAGELVTVARSKPAAQTPVGEGPLRTTPFLGQTIAGASRSFPGLVEADGIALFDGTLSGITVGSTFAIYQRQQALLSQPDARSLTRVVDVSPQRARLARVEGLKPGTEITAVEIARTWGALQIPIGMRGLSDSEAKDALAGLDFVIRDDRNPKYIVTREGGPLRLLDTSGEQRVAISKLKAGSDAERINETLRRVANAEALLALPRKPAAERMGALSIETEGCTDCKMLRGSADLLGPAVSVGDRFRLLVKGQGDKTLYPYLFEVTPQFGINRLYPPGGASDKLPADGFFYVGNAVRAARPGDFRLVLILSRELLAAGPIEQGSLPRAGGCQQTHALAQLLCAASRGTRASGALPAGDFDVITTTLMVNP